ncbi:MAG: hypothetical protein R3242_05235 [Akkermansiaceae bacterium]|nr:hypothetical protein [Akkermansiaceae bacterium]
MKNKDEYIQNSKSALNDLSTKIDRLEHDLTEKKIEADAEVKKQLNSLKLKRKELKNRAEELKGTSDENWNSAREHFDKAINELRDGFSKVKGKLSAAVS